MQIAVQKSCSSCNAALSEFSVGHVPKVRGLQCILQGCPNRNEKFNGKCERRQVICLFFAPTTKACRVRFSQSIYMRTSSHEFAFEFAIFRFMIYFPISYVFSRVILSDSCLSFFFLSISTPNPNTALPVTSNRRANQVQECR